MTTRSNVHIIYCRSLGPPSRMARDRLPAVVPAARPFAFFDRDDRRPWTHYSCRSCNSRRFGGAAGKRKRCQRQHINIDSHISLLFCGNTQSCRMPSSARRPWTSEWSFGRMMRRSQKCRDGLATAAALSVGVAASCAGGRLRKPSGVDLHRPCSWLSRSLKGSWANGLRPDRIHSATQPEHEHRCR
jgi:hypothetical protein